ncbi:MAG: hypothetical protein HEQ35_01805 [Gloeotrichia echinulata IR180]
MAANFSHSLKICLENRDWGLGIGDWGLGIALLCETLRVACFHVVVRLRSVTRDWGLGIGACFPSRPHP